MRATVIAMGDADHVLFISTHHIVSDGWSKSVFFRELGELYAAYRAGRNPELPELPIQYADFAAWERSEARHGETAEHLAYWREQLRGPLPSLALPTDRPRPPRPGAAGAHASLVVPPETVAALKRFAAENGATFYMVLLAAYQTLLHRYTGQSDIVVGSPIAGRGRPELEGLIGYFATLLPLRTRFETPQSFAQLLEDVVETCLGAFEHEEVPLEQLSLELQRDGRPADAPLFQAVLTMEDTVPAPITLDGVNVESLDVAFDATKFDLTMMVAERPDGVRFALWYRTELFDHDTVERMVQHFGRLLDAVIADPDRVVGALPMLTDAEQAAFAAWNPTPVAPAAISVVGAVAAHAASTPDRVAVVSGDTRLTYAELEARARAIGAELRRQGVGVGDRVGLLAGRSVDAIAGLLGIWHAGAAYVPLTPEMPAERIASIAAIAGVRAIVAQSILMDGRVPAGIPVVTVDAASSGDIREAASPAGDVPAYVLFTSGSTGEPKGVVVTHANLMAYTAGIIAKLEVPPDSAWSWATVSTLAADLGHTAVFPALVTGGTLHVVPEAATTDGTVWAEYVAAHPLDVVKITPSHLRALLGGNSAVDDRARLPKRWLVLGGEACPWSLVEQVRRSGECRVLNHYGPTETTVGACAFEVTEQSATALKPRSTTVPIGRPLPQATAEVLDTLGGRVPVGVVGELYLGGYGVAQGYLGRDDLTAERFTADPLSNVSGGRRYRTGDRVRRLRSGDIEFLGRLDGQVKVRGYRVELGEIEHVVREHPGVAQCVVLVRGGGGDDASASARVVAYVVARAGGYAAAHAERATAEAIQGWVGERLPDYMVPSSVLFLDALPLTANGKVDYRALPDPEVAVVVETYVAPRTETESALATIWSDVLKKECVGVTDSFMTLGGHSLLAIRVLGKLSKQFGIRLPLRTLFDAPTIESLARVVDDEVQAAKQRELDVLLASVDGMSDADVQRLMADQGSGGDTT